MCVKSEFFVKNAKTVKVFIGMRFIGNEIGEIGLIGGI